jgi:phosphatidylglycerophosphatase A
LVIEASEDTRETSAPRPRLALLIATGAGSGYAPVAPGTFGSALGVLLYLPFSYLGLPLYGVTLVGLLFLGIWAAGEAERVFRREDDGRIVIDEVVGQLLGLLPLLALAPRLHPRSPLWLLAGFLIFRLFDIWKPGPVRWAERRFAGGTAVMLDDVAAGILAAVALGVAALLVAS